MYPKILAGIEPLTTGVFKNTPFSEADGGLTPSPANPAPVPLIVAKLNDLDAHEFAWTGEEVATRPRRATAPTVPARN